MSSNVMIRLQLGKVQCPTGEPYLQAYSKLTMHVKTLDLKMANPEATVAHLDSIAFTSKIIYRVHYGTPT